MHCVCVDCMQSGEKQLKDIWIVCSRRQRCIPRSESSCCCAHTRWKNKCVWLWDADGLIALTPTRNLRRTYSQWPIHWYGWKELRIWWARRRSLWTRGWCRPRFRDSDLGLFDRIFTCVQPTHLVIVKSGINSPLAHLNGDIFNYWKIHHLKYFENLWNKLE